MSNVFAMNNIARNISVSVVGIIRDVASDRFVSSSALSSLSGGCLFVPKDCYIVALE
jgi:hypothetical protein